MKPIRSRGRAGSLLQWGSILTVLGLLGPIRAAEKRDLFNGRDLTGWREPVGSWMAVKGVTLDAQDQRKFLVQDGEGVLINGREGRTGNLRTEWEHGDVEAHVEFVVPEGSNSGIYFQGRYEIQVLDSWGKENLAFGDCGGLYASCSAEPKCYEGRPPPFNVSRAPGEWQSFDVIFRAPRFDASGQKVENARFVKVIHNGRVIHENVEVACPTCAAAWEDEQPIGPLMLQGDHGPVAFRNLWIKPVTLHP